MGENTPTTDDRVVIVNPVAGTGDHVGEVKLHAANHGFDVQITQRAGDAMAYAEDAAGADIVAACGGDGTINKVIQGLRRSHALPDTTLGVVPAGTGNNFADKIGITTIAHAFEVMATGERRHIDIGTAIGNGNSRIFVNSCICGLTAEASADTDHDQKHRLGTLAYAINTLREARQFDALPLHVQTTDESAQTWDGDALAVLVGNGRRFPPEGSAQADMEDGLLDVAIIADEPAFEMVREEARRRLLDTDSTHITRLQTSALTLAVQTDDNVYFSLDGEMLEATQVDLAVDHQQLSLYVGETYEPTPTG